MTRSGFKYTSIAPGSSKYIQWLCSCGSWHTGSAYNTPSHVHKHIPQVNVEKWLPIGSKAYVPRRGLAFTVVGYDLDNWDVLLDLKEPGWDSPGRCSLDNCIPERIKH